MANGKINEHERGVAIRLAKDILLLEEKMEFDAIWHLKTQQFRNIVANNEVFTLPDNRVIDRRKDRSFHQTVRAWAKL